MRDILFDIGITLGKRRTIKQKKVFLEELEKKINEYKVNYKIIDTKHIFFSSKHVIVGDVNKSKLILIGNYDTPTINLCRRSYYPLLTKENIITDQLNLIISIMVFIILNSFFAFSFNYINSLSLIIQFFLLFIEGLLFLLSIKLIDGISNPINQNRNSASIALMLDLLRKNSKDISFIFMDNSGTLAGYKQCIEYLDNCKPKIVLDSIASGKELYFTNINNQNFANVKIIKTEGKYWFNQVNNMGILFSGEFKNNKYTVDNSRFFNDYKINQERLIIIEEELLKLIER